MNTINKLLACFGVKLVSNKGYLEHLTRKEWAEREQELVRKLHNQRVLTNYHRKKASRSSCIDNAIEEAS
jgi:hypothetical protein